MKISKLGLFLVGLFSVSLCVSVDKKEYLLAEIESNENAMGPSIRSSYQAYLFPYGDLSELKLSDLIKIRCFSDIAVMASLANYEQYNRIMDVLESHELVHKNIESMSGYSRSSMFAGFKNDIVSTVGIIFIGHPDEICELAIKIANILNS